MVDNFLLCALLTFCYLGVIRSVNFNGCPDLCSCLGTYADCAQRKLDKIPSDFPSWVKELDMSDNDLKDNNTAPLSKLPLLTELKLNNNALRWMPVLNLPLLRQLELSRNVIESFDVEAFINIPMLQDLDLSSNKLEKIPVNSFPMSNKITYLNLNNNKIRVIENTTFDNLTSLTELKLNRNRLSLLNIDVFKHTRLLHTLELNRNQFEEIKGLVFQNLKYVTSVKLRRNRIRYLRDGAFFGLASISVLQLDYNFINSVQKAGLYGLSNLTTLSLTHNLITHIEDNGWEFCVQLQELYMSYNQMSAIKRETFQHLSNLQRLKLDGNKIAAIEEGAFSSMPNLEELDLSNNQISWTVEDQNAPFIGLNNLSKFRLGSNRIKSIGQNAFVGLKSLVYLDLCNNNITSINDNAFLTMPDLRDLILNTTSLLCDCNLQWLNKWLQNNTKLSVVAAVCAYPVWLRGQPVTSLQTENFTCDDSPKPRITDEPKSQMAIKGSNVTLLCKASSSLNVPMNFLWKRNNINLDGAEVSEFARSPDGKSTEASSELRLFDVTHHDAGKYQCVVENGYGTTYSQRSKIVVVTYPTFDKIPTNVTVRTGSTAKLECKAKGQPQPQIAWQKDGGNDFPAARERRMHVMPTDDVFFITNAKIADMGVYSCTAQNPAGVIVANATLNILETPSFVKPMENKETTAGESVVLECMASGSPKPALQWLKDGGPLKATERHFFTAEDQLLIIMDTILTDSGNYECEMTNTLGMDKGFTKLKVNPAESTVVNEDDMMGIIIISVVCCAVGTSIVWVVIIYQTRKSMISTQSTQSELVPALTDVVDEPHGTKIYTDTVSEHSSCKDSGTGDSAKRSSDDLFPQDFSVPIPVNEIPNTTSAQVYSHPRPTNHKRLSQTSIQSAELESLSDEITVQNV